MNPDGVTKPNRRSLIGFFFLSGESLLSQAKKEKAAFREAEWKALGKADAKWIINDHPDGVTKSFGEAGGLFILNRGELFRLVDKFQVLI